MKKIINLAVLLLLFVQSQSRYTYKYEFCDYLGGNFKTYQV